MAWHLLRRLFGGKPRPHLKQFIDLRRSDFMTHPVWIGCHTADYAEPWYDDTDEETFRPWTGSLPVNPEEGILLVKAKFQLTDGRIFDGFCTPQHPGPPPDLGTMQPCLFASTERAFAFWDGGIKRCEEDRLAFYAALGTRDPAKIFPVQFYAYPGLATGQTNGQIHGFYWLRQDLVEVYH